MATMNQRVDAGVEFLDERLPGWRDEIDVDELELDSCEKCILGQLFGSYERGASILGLTRTQSLALGFNQSRGSWNRLTAAWRGWVLG